MGNTVMWNLVVNWNLKLGEAPPPSRSPPCGQFSTVEVQPYASSSVAWLSIARKNFTFLSLEHKRTSPRWLHYCQSLSSEGPCSFDSYRKAHAGKGIWPEQDDTQTNSAEFLLTPHFWVLQSLKPNTGCFYCEENIIYSSVLTLPKALLLSYLSPQLSGD